MIKYCLRCSAENDADAVRCRICNSAFFSEVTDGPRQDSARRLVCGQCKRYISDVGLVCPDCGYSVASSKADTTVVRHLKLRHSSGAEMIASSGSIIGRDFVGKELLRDDLYVSASHLRATQMGKYFELQDISSNNSFFVNMRPIEKNGRAVIESGDVIKIGTGDFTAVIF